MREEERTGKQPVRVVSIVGPTASGKSDLAELVALRLHTCVVSADAMQVYRGMDIGTAKVPLTSRKVPLKCVDIVDPDEAFSVALYSEHAHAEIDAAIQQNGMVVVCGGTGLYVRAALEDMGFPEGEQVDNPVRERYTLLAHEMGPKPFHEMLERRDPESALLIHPNNVRRVVRAFELLEQGTSYAKEHETLHVRIDRHRTLHFGIDVDRAELYRRIDARVDQMVADGLVEEVETLVKRGLGETLTARQAIGYKEIVDALAGNVTLEEAIDSIKRSSRRYAKRQLTWFRSDKRVRWLDANELQSDGMADEIIKNIQHEDEQQA